MPAANLSAEKKPQSAVTATPFSLIETMHCRHRVRLLSAHLDRMASSASYFSIPFKKEEARLFVEELVQLHAIQDVPYKVRITLDQAGTIAGTVQPINRPAPKERRLCLSPVPVDPGDPFFYHKTTRRSLYETMFANARQAGFDEVLFLNTDRMLAEASRHNVFVRVGNEVVTPPLASGILGGVYRQQILNRCHGIVVRPVSKATLDQATAIYLCNAVWGLRRYDVKGIRLPVLAVGSEA